MGILNEASQGQNCHASSNLIGLQHSEFHCTLPSAQVKTCGVVVSLHSTSVWGNLHRTPGRRDFKSAIPCITVGLVGITGSHLDEYISPPNCISPYTEVIGPSE